MDLVMRSGNFPQGCRSCLEVRMKQGSLDGNLKCNTERGEFWQAECTRYESDIRNCWFQDCYPDDDDDFKGICGSSLIDHRTFNSAWSKITANASNYFLNPSRVCARRFLLDKMKDPLNMHVWWDYTRPSNTPASWKGRGFFPDYTEYLLWPDIVVTRALCKHVSPKSPANVGPGVDGTNNFQDDW